MTQEFLPKFTRSFSISALLAAAGLAGWALPSAAAPQLLFNIVETNGDLNACLSRAQAAVAEANLMPLSPSQLSISGGNADLTVTIYCETPTPQMFQATVMLAGEHDSAFATLNEVMGTVDTVLSAGTVSPYPTPTNPFGGTMTGAEFEQFMVALNDSWPDSLDFIAQSARTSYFTAAQAAAIVRTLQFGGDEVPAAVMLYPRVVDLRNWYLVEQAVTFHSDRRDLREQLTELF
ncbi:MAG: DUF4476 domain-containing protein [Cyanobacteria bacterium P01_C01_bin.70]